MPFSLSEIFNNLAATVEDYLNNAVGASDPCNVCPDAFGCIDLDLSDCNNFEVLVTEDITCIRIVGEGAPGRIDFIIPPDTTRRLCGFPASWGGEGNECDVALAGGPKGATFSFPHGGSVGGGMGAGGGEGVPVMPNTGSSQGGAGGGGSCICNAEDGLLKVTCCSSNCKIDCANGDLSILTFRACGGKPPYTWTTTSGSITATGVAGNIGTLSPPVNANPGQAGDAFFKSRARCSTVGGGAVCAGASCKFAGYSHRPYGCNSVATAACHIHAARHVACQDAPPFYGDTQGEADGCNGSLTLPTCDGNANSGVVCDTRTAPMIANGCNPCEVAVNNAVVTATDALGVSVATTVSG